MYNPPLRQNCLKQRGILQTKDSKDFCERHNKILYKEVGIFLGGTKKGKKAVLLIPAASKSTCNLFFLENI